MIDIFLPILFLMGIVFVIGLVMLPFILWGRKQRRTLLTQITVTKALYEKALFDLQTSPDSSSKHQEALSKGREYYSFLHPNTYDQPINGVASNFRDNAGIVEAKVQSDIQARIGKGKVS